MVQLPGEEEVLEYTEPSSARAAASLRLGQSGFVRIYSEGRPSERYAVPVNIEAGEGDTRAISVDEFAMKLASTPVLLHSSSAGGAGSALYGDDQIVEREYGRYFLVILFVVLVVESWYMSRLAR